MKSLSMPFVTVIVPVFRTSIQLPRCLDSILINRADLEMEIVIVNDCSDDDSWKVMQHYKREYPDEIQLVRHTENRGLPYARQSGADVANGSYLLHVDSDDALAPGALVDMILRAKQTDADIIQAPLQYATEPYPGAPLSEIEIERTVKVLEGELSGAEVAKSLGHYWSRKFLQYTVTGKLYKRTLWQTTAPLLPDHPSLGEDVIFNVQLTAAADKAVLLSRPGVIYIRRKGSYMEECWGAEQFSTLFENGAWIANYLHQIKRQDLMLMTDTYVRDIVLNLGTRRAKEGEDKSLIAYLQLMLRYIDLFHSEERKRSLKLLYKELKKRRLLNSTKPLLNLLHQFQ